MRTLTLSAAAAMVLASIQAAHAAGFTDGSFEAGVAPNFGPAWSASGAVELQDNTGYIFDGSNTNNYHAGASDGVKAAVFNDGGTATGTVAQTFDTTPGTTYNVLFDFGLYGDNSGGQQGIVAVAATGNAGQSYSDPTGTPYALATIDQAFVRDNLYTFTATASSTTLSFTGNATGQFVDVGLDNIRVTAEATSTVPEPASLSIVASLGAAALLRRRR